MPLAYQGDEESARRKFERDKEELRKLGMRVRHYTVTHQIDSSLRTEHLYTASEGIEKLPDIPLSSKNRQNLSLLFMKAIREPTRHQKERHLLYAAAQKIFHKDPDLSKQMQSIPPEFSIESTFKEKSNKENEIDSPNTSVRERDSFPKESLELVYDSLKKRQKIQIIYDHSNTSNERRILSGRGLISHKRRWCLVAWCHKNSDIRHFYIDRMKSIEISQEPSLVDPSFNIRKYSLHPLTLSIHPPQKAKLHISQSHEENFRDFIRGAKKALPFYKEKDSFFYFETTNQNALFSWMLRNNGAVLAMGPLALRQDFLECIKDTKSLYQRLLQTESLTTE